MKTAYLITARLKSTRLKRKVLRDVCGRPLIAHLTDRARFCASIDEVVICTSTSPEDDDLEEFALREGVGCYRGHPEDVVDRLWRAAVSVEADYILNITADCPLADPQYADRIVDHYRSTSADFIRALSLPHGIFSYGVTTAALERVVGIKDTPNTEVWGSYLTDTDAFAVADLPVLNERHRRPNLRLTVDYPEDLALIQTIFERLYTPGSVFSLDDVLELLDSEPGLIEINRSRHAQYKMRWASQSEPVLRPRHTVERAVVVGCGSIGQRHIRNLRVLGITDILAVRSRRGHAQDLDPGLKVQETDDWEAVAEFGPDIGVVANPTALHMDAAARLLPHVRGVFIEKPIDAALEPTRPFLTAAARRKVTTFVGFNLQFHPGVKTIFDLLRGSDLGAVLSVQCLAGHWLPDWHPYRDYRQAYFSRRELGGGPLLTLIHDIHLAAEIQGPGERVVAFGSTSDLIDADVESSVDVMIRHTKGVSQVHLDFLQRPPQRSGTISCERGWIRYDLIHGWVDIQTSNDTVPRRVWEASTDSSDSYQAELELFLQYVREGRVRHQFTVERALASQAIVDVATESLATGQVVAVPDWVGSFLA